MAFRRNEFVSFGAGVAAAPCHRAVEVVVPFRLEAGAEGHQSQAGVEVRHPKRCTERVQRPCFCVVVRMRVEVHAVRRAAGGPHLQRVRQGRKGLQGARSQRTSGRSPGCSLLQEGTAH